MKKILLLLTLAFCGTANAQNTCTPLITSGLVAYYSFCGNANDASGNANTGTVNGATLTNDRYGNANRAYNFNGTSDFIQVAHSASLTFKSGVSISFWLQMPDYSLNTTGLPERNPIGKHRTSAQDGIQFETNDNTGTLGTPQFSVSDIGTTASYEDNVALPLNNWIHLVGTYDGTSAKLYKNGVLLGTGTYSVNLSNITQDLFIGKDGALGRFFKGDIDDIAIYNRVLSVSEIQQLEVGSTSNCLVAYYPFTGNASDSTGNGYNGTVFGATLTTDRFSNPNSAYSFSSGNYIAVADAVPLRLANTDFTIAAWVFLNDTLSQSVNYGSYAIVSKRDLSNGTDDYIFGITAPSTTVSYGAGYVTLATNNITGDSRSNSKIVLNTWQHVLSTYTYSTQTVRTYINGVLNSTTTSIPAPSSSVTANLWIGNDVSGSPYFFHGKIDDVRIYNCTLSATDVQAVYDGTTGITDISYNAEFSVYPNPTNGILNIKGIKNERVVVYNSLGSIVKESKTENEIDLSKYSGGLYFIQVIDNNGKAIYTAKILRE